MCLALQQSAMNIFAGFVVPIASATLLFKVNEPTTYYGGAARHALMQRTQQGHYRIFGELYAIKEVCVCLNVNQFCVQMTGPAIRKNILPMCIALITIAHIGVFAEIYARDRILPKLYSKPALYEK